MKYEKQLALALFALSWAGASAQDPTLPVSEVRDLRYAITAASV